MEVDSAISTPCDLNSSPKFDMAVDPEYEFHAPKFYDFTKGDDNSSLSGDSFFDKMENEEWPLPSLGKMTLNENNVDIVSTKQPPVPSASRRPLLGTAMLANHTVNGFGANHAVEKDKLRFGPRVAPSPVVGVKKCIPLPTTATKAFVFNGPARVHVAAPSPTVGVNKCVPQPTTEAKGFVLRTQQRAQVSRKRQIAKNIFDRGQSAATENSTGVSNAKKSKSELSPTGLVPAIAKSASYGNIQNGIHSSRTQAVSKISRRSASCDQLAKAQLPNRAAPPGLQRGRSAVSLKNDGKPPMVPKITAPVAQVGKNHKTCQENVVEGRKRRQTEGFRARPMPDFRHPFLPRTAPKPGEVKKGIMLHTERRSEERKAFDVALKMREVEAKEKMAQIENDRRRQEEENIKKLRRTLVHRPQPFHIYKPFEVKHGVIPTTVPKSPKFATDQRFKGRLARK